MASGNKTIAKNTVFLYIRTFITMIISLYTSRVILQVLGINDFGIYQAVGGIVGLLSFLNSALSAGTSRFLIYELGTGNKEKLKNTFSTTLTVHIILSLIIVLLGETLGLWYFNTKMVISADRFSAAAWVFHLSMLTAIISIVSVPFNSAIIAHERMKIFAYIGVVDAILRLAIVFLLTSGNIDKLILYAVLLLLLQLSLFIFYVLYCKLSFNESKVNFFFIDKKLFKEIFSFSGWGIIAGSAIALNTQGILLLLNYFFTPSVVAARAVSLQVYSAANLFVSNFRTAANPQIVKKLAAGDIVGSHNLLLQSTKFSYYLMLLLCLPICLLASPLLNLWLIEVPDYAVPFLQLVIIQSLFQVFDTSFYTALYAVGRIKENALISPMISLLSFPIVFVLFKMGASPLALSWISIIVFAIAGFLLKPMLIVKIADYSWSEIFSMMRICLIVTLMAVPMPLITFILLDVDHNIGHFGLVLVTSVVSVCLAVWYFGMTAGMKQTLLIILKARYQSMKWKL